jgi:hypothetical protein
LSDGDLATFLLHSATALEQLAKAVLAQMNPTFIAANDFDSLLRFSDHSQHVLPKANPRTITATEAIDRVSRFVPIVGNEKSQLGLQVAVRNGVAHLGVVSHADAKGALPSYLKASEALRNELGMSRKDYWKEFESVVDSSLEEHVTEVRLHVETALAAARAEYDNRYGGLDATDRETMLKVIEASYPPLSRYEEDVIECPVCDRTAVVAGNYTTDWDVDFDRDGQPEGAYVTVTLHPSYLHCRICQLELSGEDELQAAGVPSSWGLDVDQSDFREYDWDEAGY